MIRELRQQIAARVRAVVQPIVAREGVELVEVEVLGSGRAAILRLVVDKPGGISLDDCAEVSHAVEGALEVEDPFEGAWSLEVSSPGLDRPLVADHDFTRFQGRRARLRCYAPVPEAGNRKSFTGTLRGIAAGRVAIEVEGTIYQVPRAAISKAHLEPNFQEKQESKLNTTTE